MPWLVEYPLRGYGSALGWRYGCTTAGLFILAERQHWVHTAQTGELVELPQRGNALAGRGYGSALGWRYGCTTAGLFILAERQH